MKRICALMCCGMYLMLPLGLACKAANTPAMQNPQTLFQSASMSIADWETTAKTIVSSNEDGVDYFYGGDGNLLGCLFYGPVYFAAAGYERSDQGLLDGFNDYRGAGRWTLLEDHKTSPLVIELDDYAREVIRIANTERVAAGLNEMQIDNRMMEFASVRVRELPVRFSHQRPDGTYVTALGYGENLSFDRADPAIAVEKWMASPSHRSNILLAGIEYVGAACYRDKDGVLYWTMLFAYDV